MDAFLRDVVQHAGMIPVVAGFLALLFSLFWLCDHAGREKGLKD